MTRFLVSFFIEGQRKRLERKIQSSESCWDWNQPRCTDVNECITGRTVVQARANGDVFPMGASVTFSVFFPNRPGGHTPRQILTQNGSNDVDSRTHVPFGGKNCNFLKPLTLRPPKPPKFAQFLSGLRKFLLDFALNIGGLTSKRPLFFIGAQ